MSRSADEIRVGVSTCLLGEHVRYDGGHKHDRYLTDVLGRHIRLVPVCPEVEMGMGTPREPVRLVRDGDTIRMVGTNSGKDHTTAMRRFAARRVAALAPLALCGYVLKKGSPSCGMEKVKTYTPRGMPAPSSRGMFAAALLAAFPDLPVEEEGRLIDPVLRENFLVRVFAYARVSALFTSRWRIADLVAFHSREKLLVAAHRPASEKELGRLVATAKGRERAELAEGYRAGFLAALAKPALPRRHVNVLQHMLGYLRELAPAGARASLAATIEEYRRGLVPLVVPLALLRHYVDLHGIEYLARQTYLAPHPKELLLRSRV